MEELLRFYFLTYSFMTLFVGIVVFQLLFYIIKKSRKKEFSKKQTALYVVLWSACSGFFMWILVYMHLYPMFLAYYEYKNDVVEETVGVIECIEQDGKDRIYVTIDGREYVMAYSSTREIYDMDRRFNEGDTVKIQFGKRSKYIFEISESFQQNKEKLCKKSLIMQLV